MRMERQHDVEEQLRPTQRDDAKSKRVSCGIQGSIKEEEEEGIISARQGKKQKQTIRSEEDKSRERSRGSHFLCS